MDQVPVRTKMDPGPSPSPKRASGLLTCTKNVFEQLPIITTEPDPQIERVKKEPSPGDPADPSGVSRVPGGAAICEPVISEQPSWFQPPNDRVRTVPEPLRGGGRASPAPLKISCLMRSAYRAQLQPACCLSPTASPRTHRLLFGRNR